MRFEISGFMHLGPVSIHVQSWWLGKWGNVTGDRKFACFVLNRKGVWSTQPGIGPYSHTAWWLRVGIIAVAWRW